MMVAQTMTAPATPRIRSKPVTSAPNVTLLYRDKAHFWAKRLGCEALPTVGKGPAFLPGDDTHRYAWQKNALGKPGVHPATPELWAKANGFGLAYPAGSTGAFLDIDNGTFYQTLCKTLPILATALRFERGSDHQHIPLKLAYPLPKACLSVKGNGHELGSLRGPGALIIGPGCYHESGHGYTVVEGPYVTLTKDQTDHLIAAFESEPAHPKVLTSDTLGKQRFNPAVVQAVIDGIEKKVGHPLRFSSTGTASFRAWWRQDEHHSAYFSRNRYRVYDAAHGDRAVYNLKALCEEFEINYQKLGGLYAGTPGPEPIKLSPDMVLRRDLIAANKIALARFLDLLLARPQAPYTRKEILTFGADVEMRRAAVDRALAKAVEAGYVLSPCRGSYCLSPEIFPEARSNTLPFPPEAYHGPTSTYRRAFLAMIERLAQPEDRNARPVSAAKLAGVAGLSRRTLYRHEKKIGIERFKWIVRTEIRSTADIHAAGWLEVVDQQLQTLQRLHPDQFTDATAYAQDVSGRVLFCQQYPSIRLLPGQERSDRIPDGAILINTTTYQIDHVLTTDTQGVPHIIHPTPVNSENICHPSTRKDPEMHTTPEPDPIPTPISVPFSSPEIPQATLDGRRKDLNAIEKAEQDEHRRQESAYKAQHEPDDLIAWIVSDRGGVVREEIPTHA